MPREIKNLKIPPTRFGLNHYKALGYYPRKIAQGPEHEPSMTPTLRKEPGTTPAVGKKPVGEGLSAGPVAQPPADELFPTIPEKPPVSLYSDKPTSKYDDAGPATDESAQREDFNDFELDPEWQVGKESPQGTFDPYEEWNPENEEVEQELDRGAEQETPSIEDADQWFADMAETHYLARRYNPADYTNFTPYLKDVQQYLTHWAELDGLSQDQIKQIRQQASQWAKAEWQKFEEGLNNG